MLVKAVYFSCQGDMVFLGLVEVVLCGVYSSPGFLNGFFKACGFLIYGAVAKEGAQLLFVLVHVLLQSADLVYQRLAHVLQVFKAVVYSVEFLLQLKQCLFFLLQGFGGVVPFSLDGL